MSRKKDAKYIVKDAEISSHESDEEDSDEENSNEENSGIENCIEEQIKNLLRERFILKKD